MNLNKRTLLKELWNFQALNRKVLFILLLGLMTLATFLEVVSLGAILPFLAALTDPEGTYAIDQLQPFIKYLKIESPRDLLFPLAVFFIIVVTVAALVRLILLYASIRFSLALGADLSAEVYRRTLYQDYSIHVSTNSSEAINTIVRKTNTVSFGVITSLLTLITSIFLIIGIVTALLAISIQAAFISFFGFGSFYGAILFFSKKKLNKNGEIQAKEGAQIIKTAQEGLGGIRDVLLDNNQEFYTKLFTKSDLSYRKAYGTIQIISGIPRFIMEAVGMILIVLLAYSMTYRGDSIGVLPILGALALGAQRLLPAIQNAYACYTTILGSTPEFRDTMLLLRQPLNAIDKGEEEFIEFNESLSLKNINFKYAEDTPLILKNLNLKILKGSRVGFIGVTGSGKSTLLDLIMMLLWPTSGDILVDSKILSKVNKKSWQKHIAHVPQLVFLADSTIEENIAFGIPKELINKERVKEAAKKSELSVMIENLKNGYETAVGEQGLMLSGGQRQRIGIARALYKQSSILIFDEATSALDSETELRIMNTINSLDKNLTILIIAHRISTLKECDYIVDLSETGYPTIKEYNDLLSTMSDETYKDL